MARDGARFVMLGTPNQGAHSMVENLLGKGSTLRTLVRLDVKHDMQEVLDIVAGFRGALQLLPKPGFIDIFQGQPDGGELHELQTRPRPGSTFKPKVRDFWFGDGKSATPAQDVLDSASWLWRQDGLARPALPAAYEKQERLRVRRRTQHAVRRARGRRPAEDGRHDARRRHGELGIRAASAASASFLLHAGRARRPAVDGGVLPGAGRSADHRRTPPPGDAAARRARDRAAAAGRPTTPARRPPTTPKRSRAA